MSATRFLLLGDWNLDPLARLLNLDGDPAIQAQAGPFDQTVPVLRGPLDADYVVVWTRPEGASSRLRARLTLEDAEDDLAELLDAIRSAAERVRGVFVVTWVMPPGFGTLGLGDADPHVGFAGELAQINARLYAALGDVPNAWVLDAAGWLAQVGPQAYDPRLWSLAKVAWAQPLLRVAAREIRAGLGAILGRSRKLLILDLDDTLWGGTVGEVGWQGLQLGGHDPIGEAFVAFQKQIKALTRAGVILAIASKNDEPVALEAIHKHPEMVLRAADFATWRINWLDKATNIAEMLEELNLGPESAVFLDDSPGERARVREALPQVLVPEQPKDKMLYGKALRDLRCFDRPGLTAEDAKRAAMYRQEGERRSLRSEVASQEDWLAALELCITLEPLAEGNLKRATQLLNKTNQMNVATRRMSEAELLACASEGRVVCVRVEDRFGDYGLTGLVGVQGDMVTDFLLSCRVMGRGVEQAMLALVGELAQGRPVRFGFRATERNGPMLDFLTGQGFAREGEAFLADELPPYPTYVRLVRAE